MAFTVKRFKDYIYNELNKESRTRHMNDRAIQFEDAEGRKIKISPDEGVQVEDSEGTIIHDTPDCVIAADMLYGGHIYFKKTGAVYISTGYSHKGVETLKSWESAYDKQVSSYLPSDITNITAGYGYVDCYYNVAGAKNASGLYLSHQLSFGTTYGDTGPHYNYIGWQQAYSQSLDADDQPLMSHNLTMAIIPIVQTTASTEYYINLYHAGQWLGANAVNANITAGFHIALFGFLA